MCVQTIYACAWLQCIYSREARQNACLGSGRIDCHGTVSNRRYDLVRGVWLNGLASSRLRALWRSTCKTARRKRDTRVGENQRVEETRGEALLPVLAFNLRVVLPSFGEVLVSQLAHIDTAWLQYLHSSCDIAAHVLFRTLDRQCRSGNTDESLRSTTVSNVILLSSA
jgi:hypothetical protein